MFTLWIPNSVIPSFRIEDCYGLWIMYDSRDAEWIMSADKFAYRMWHGADNYIHHEPVGHFYSNEEDAMMFECKNMRHN